MPLPLPLSIHCHPPQRVYVNFETGEWQPFPKEWEALGSFEPVEEGGDDEGEAEEWGTLEHDGNTLSGGSGSGSGLLTVAGECRVWQCGHFEWSDGWDWSILGGMTVIGDGGRCD
jgi:hypothetical protein